VAVLFGVENSPDQAVQLLMNLLKLRHFFDIAISLQPETVQPFAQIALRMVHSLAGRHILQIQQKRFELDFPHVMLLFSQKKIKVHRYPVISFYKCPSAISFSPAVPRLRRDATSTV